MRGFTLIELMVALFIGLLLMAGIYSNFIMQSSVQSMQANVTERMEDLYLASHIMQRELRTAATVDLGTTNEINYTDVDGNAGVFRYTPATGKICWDLPGDAASVGCQELIRDLDTSSGMVVTSSGSGGNTIYTVTLNAVYEDKDHVQRTVNISFKVWPRN